MSTTRSLIHTALVAVAATAAFAFTATANAGEVVKLPRVVITGKAVVATQVVQLPRVVIHARANSGEQQVAQLPRVEIRGVSLATQLQRQALAAVKTNTSSI